MEIWNRVVCGNAISTWLTSLLVGVAVLAVLSLLKRLLLRRIVALTERTKTEFDDLIVELFTRSWMLVLLAVSLWSSSLVLYLPGAESTIQIVLWILILLQVAIFGSGVVAYLVVWWTARAQENGDKATSAAYKSLGVLAKIVLWAAVVLVALDSIPGVEVDTLIAGLGIGGIAVALAVQTVLGDVFASVSILLDKPFEVGDFINVGDYSGTVEYIGLKSTRLRSLTGEQVVFGNSDLLGSRIRNYKRMQARRATFTIGVACETPHDKLVRIPEILENIVKEQSETEFMWARFATYGEFSLDFEVVYKMLTANYATYIEVQQAINLAIHKRFEEEGIALPYPTQTVYLRSSGS